MGTFSEILTEIYFLTEVGFSITFLRVSSHIGIFGNGKANAEAKKAPSGRATPETILPIGIEDVTSVHQRSTTETSDSKSGELKKHS